MTDYRSALVLMPQAGPDGEVDNAFDSWLEGAGWNAALQVLRPSPAHETLGWRECIVVGCSRPAWDARGRGLCNGCLAVWRDHGQPDLEAFSQRPSRRVEYQIFDRCSVIRDGVQCGRKASAHGMCKRHADRVRHHVSVRNRPQAEVLKTLVPYPSAGDCKVVACDRPALYATVGLCSSHACRWRRMQENGSQWSFDDFCRRTHQITDSRFVVFRGLHPRVTRQILYGVYTRSRRGSLTRTQQLQQVIDYIRALEVTDLRDAKYEPRPDIWPRSSVRPLLNTILKAVEYGDLKPEDFRHAEVWPGAVFGMNSQIDFRPITQPWLRAMVQSWCWDHLHRFGDFTSFIKMVNEITYFSEYLRGNTKGHGEDISALDREAVAGFANHVAALARASASRTRNKIDRGGQNLRFTWNKNVQIGCLLSVQRMLRYGRETDQMEAFAGSFMITDDLIPARGSAAHEHNIGRALLMTVMRQLFSADNQAAFEKMQRYYPRLLRILAETGRRPSEIMALRYNCIDNGDGGPFLIYTETKVSGGERRVLPVLRIVVDTVREQQAVVRERYPDTDPGDLCLFPRFLMNAHGYHSAHVTQFGKTFGDWIRALPRLDSDELGEDGQALPFDRTKISAYSFRHTYAQRHADAGTPPDVLKELMGHEAINTTMGYYRITQKRRREAAELVGNLVISGTVLTAAPMSKSHRLAAEHATIAVPFGKCSNPQNVAAEGHGCPIRHRCFGCGSFSSDPSYLPEMRRRLLDLKAIRARIDAFEGAAEWAKRDARPSDEEIEALRQRIGEEEDKLAHATPEQRALIDEASTTLRKARAAATIDLKLGRRISELFDDDILGDGRRSAIDAVGAFTDG
ncbi:phage integrase family protein [Mycobacteroides abscessus subsp. abscessus]|uniref:tyrosine-type recombinase/integrase n=1 Tax=Mycobacteroides abscessus TaxID=36809 RepID=UPI0009A894B2|nr:site-specific integrase [Mycobacteroides abscessus]SLF34060.1 phage integrase family protein [Mycobacteroides abscessus subsp. abscessus]SLF35386.1 phage integrase family protein [Mycobacteroides abscessus subsp. abscessus]SLF35716.1 phage integrase family protein [Mycobacteroides abscessus subsp. abscessus]SLH08596.1 phage integrase family protein [Mycobacteroides abscessus subsp. abscessus]